jgi:hypothetical protein
MHHGVDQRHVGRRCLDQRGAAIAEDRLCLAQRLGDFGVQGLAVIATGQSYRHAAHVARHSEFAAGEHAHHQSGVARGSRQRAGAIERG